MSLVRIFEIPAPTGKFHFGGGEPQAFVEVDWFRDDPQPYLTSDFATIEGRAEIEKFIRAKRYFRPDAAYLVLHQAHSFTIGYSAP